MFPENDAPDDKSDPAPANRADLHHPLLVTLLRPHYKMIFHLGHGGESGIKWICFMVDKLFGRKASRIRFGLFSLLVSVYFLLRYFLRIRIRGGCSIKIKMLHFYDGMVMTVVFYSVLFY